MTLFQKGKVQLRSGRESNYKIECDALTADDWAGIAAAMIEEGVVKAKGFRTTFGVPRGGFALANALQPYAASGPEANGLPVLICEDIVTTGGSMERHLAHLRETKYIAPETPVLGVVFIARGKCPDWVTPLLQMSLPRLA